MAHPAESARLNWYVPSPKLSACDGIAVAHAWRTRPPGLADRADKTGSRHPALNLLLVTPVTLNARVALCRECPCIPVSPRQLIGAVSVWHRKQYARYSALVAACYDSDNVSADGRRRLHSASFRLEAPRLLSLSRHTSVLLRHPQEPQRNLSVFSTVFLRAQEQRRGCRGERVWRQAIRTWVG